MSQKQLIGVYISESTIGVCRITSARKFGSKRAPKVRFIDLTQTEEGHSLLDEPEYSADLLKALLKKHRIRRGDAAVAISTREAVIRSAELPVMEEKDFRAAAEMGGLWEPFSWSPTSPDEYAVDFVRHPATSAAGEGMTACMVAARSDHVARCIEIVTLAGLTPVVVDVANLSLCRALLRWQHVSGAEQGSMEQFAIYEALAEGNYVTLVDGDVPELRELYVGDLSDNTLDSDAEGGEGNLHQLSHSVASQLDGILQNTGAGGEEESADGEQQQRETPPLFLLSDLPIATPAWDGLIGALEEQGFNMQRVETFLTRSRVVSRALSQFDNREAVVSLLGLSLRRFDRTASAATCLHGAEGVNLLPGYRALRAGRKKRYLIHSLTLLLGIPLLLLMFYLHYQQWKQQADVSSRMVIYQELSSSISSNKERLARSTQSLLELQALLDAAERAGNNNSESYHVLLHVSHSIPLGIRLVEIHTADGVSVTIRGKAEKDSQILEMVDLMRRDGLFSRVSLRTIQQEKREAGAKRLYRRGGRDFILHCVVSPDFKPDGKPPKASHLFHQGNSFFANNVWPQRRG